LPGNLLPEDDDQRTRLAAVMGSRDGDTLLQEVGTRMRQNRQDFDAVCAYLASTDTNRSTQLTRTDRRT
ncbi:MAG: hypothetical protein JXA28_11865, partial [Bacteroidetes bacterium]|nr:hypothetical protein [Bacteroidota bacterium]